MNTETITESMEIIMDIMDTMDTMNAHSKLCGNYFKSSSQFLESLSKFHSDALERETTFSATDWTIIDSSTDINTLSELSKRNQVRSLRCWNHRTSGIDLSERSHGNTINSSTKSSTSTRTFPTGLTTSVQTSTSMVLHGAHSVWSPLDNSSLPSSWLVSLSWTWSLDTWTSITSLASWNERDWILKDWYL